MTDDEKEILLRTIERERAARKAAEQFAEGRTRELYSTNEQLKNLANNLQSIADERTTEIRSAKDEAERANAAKTAFLATMSHEIRTPLNVVLGMTDLVLDGELSQEHRALLKRVMANSETMLAIINDILDVSRIEAGELRIDSNPFNPREVIEDVAESLCVQAHGKRLHIVCEIDDSVPHFALGDGNRLRQILLNLGSNAVKFTQAGDIVLSASSTRDEAGTHQVEIRITDSGPGISKSKIGQVFDAFVRLEENGVNRTIQGAGLGLNISKSLAEAMGGQVSVESEEGIGSTFIARLHLGLDPDAHTEERLFPGSVFITLVHPHERSRTVLRESLKRAGAQVVDAVSLQSLEDFAGPLQNATWIVDANDPGLKANSKEFRERTLVILSDVSSQVSALRELLDANAVVPAPFRASVLYDAVETATGFRSPHRTARPVPISRPVTEMALSRVLLVEDNPDSRAVFKSILESFGLDVLQAEDGKKAVEQLNAHSVDLVLSDLQMPVMDGFALIEHIRQHDLLSGRPPMKVVALSADATTGGARALLGGRLQRVRFQTRVPPNAAIYCRTTPGPSANGPRRRRLDRPNSSDTQMAVAFGCLPGPARFQRSRRTQSGGSTTDFPGVGGYGDARHGRLRNRASPPCHQQRCDDSDRSGDRPFEAGCTCAMQSRRLYALSRKTFSPRGSYPDCSRRLARYPHSEAHPRVPLRRRPSGRCKHRYSRGRRHGRPYSRFLPQPLAKPPANS